MDRDHVVLRAEGAPSSRIPLPDGYVLEFWEPSATHILPKGVAGHYLVWWLFHQAGIFWNPGFAVVLGWKDGVLVHRSAVFPGYFRFPFMARADLQIGDVWTDEAYRRRGLAAYGLQFAMAHKPVAPGGAFWYLTRGSNTAAIAAARRVGFQRVGAATRTRRMGLRALGEFELTRDPY